MPDLVKSGSPEWWAAQLEASKHKVSELLPRWRRNRQRYRDDMYVEAGETRVNFEFEKTEGKRSQLFFRTPRVRLTGRDPESIPTAGLFADVLNDVILPDTGIDVCFREMMFDLLCTGGIAAFKTGYSSFVAGEVRLADRTVPNVVGGRYFCNRIPPDDLILPFNFDGADYNEALFLGWTRRVDREQLPSLGLPVPTSTAPTTRRSPRGLDLTRERLLYENERSQDPNVDLVDVHEIFYYRNRVELTTPDGPDRIRRIVMVDGVKGVPLMEDLRDQEFDGGRLVGGYRWLPLHVWSLRYSGGAYPPSDCRITEKYSDEVSRGRSQMLKHRNRSFPVTLISKEHVEDEKEFQQILDSDYGGSVAISGEPEKAAQTLDRGPFPRENFDFYSIAQSDVNRAWAIQDPVRQVSPQGSPSLSATQSASITRAIETRLMNERSFVLLNFVRAVQDIAALVQIYATETQYVPVVGPGGAQDLAEWTRDNIRGNFNFEIIERSGDPPDPKHDQEMALQRYNLLANSPWVDHRELIRDVIETLGGDPDRLVVKDNEQPRIVPALQISGPDLDPGMPQYPAVKKILDGLSQPGTLPAAIKSKPAEVVDRRALDLRSERGDGRLGGAG